MVKILLYFLSTWHISFISNDASTDANKASRAFHSRFITVFEARIANYVNTAAVNWFLQGHILCFVTTAARKERPHTIMRYMKHNYLLFDTNERSYWDTNQ